MSLYDLSVKSKVIVLHRGSEYKVSSVLIWLIRIDRSHLHPHMYTNNVR